MYKYVVVRKNIRSDEEYEIIVCDYKSRAEDVCQRLNAQAQYTNDYEYFVKVKEANNQNAVDPV